MDRETRPHSLTALLVGGDWACQRDRPRALAEMARLLAQCVPEPERMELEEVARLAPADMDAAGARWADVTDRIYRNLRYRGDGASAVI
jgi:hypothetical protein